MTWQRRSATVLISRCGALAAVVLLIGSLPWLSGRSPEYTVLRARYADREATPEALAQVRRELDLEGGPLATAIAWVSGALRADFGQSWVSGRPVLPSMLEALGVSLTLMACSLVVAAAVSAVLVLSALARGLRGVQTRGSGAPATVLTALPEFLLAAVLLVVGAVWLGAFPPYGWNGIGYAVLPAMALGLPAGGLVGRLLTDSIDGVFSEHWVGTWASAGFGALRVALAVLRRALLPVAAQIGLVLIGLTGGAVAVEQVFAIPGLGRATLGAASAQDIPALQAGIVLLLGVAVVIGILSALARNLLLGPGGRAGELAVSAAPGLRRRRDLIVPAAAGSALLLIVGAGILRDPYSSAYPRLAPPGWALPFGADASGRDLLARVAHGALSTVGTAAVVLAASLAIALIIGMFPHGSTGPVEVSNAAPPIIAGVLAAAVLGPSALGAAIAITAVGWAPLAAHAASLSLEVRSQPFIRVLPSLGVSRWRALWRHVLPSVAGPVARHAVLRLPGTALALASLGFLGLGPRPPAPDWGLVLAEGIDYVARAPWVTAAPALTLVLASILSVSLSSLRPAPRRPSRATLLNRDSGVH